MGTGYGPIKSLQAGYREEAGCGVEGRNKRPFSGLTGGHHVLVRSERFMFP
jgi:hypothetical protein